MRIRFKTSHADDLGLFKDRVEAGWYAALLALMLALPFVVSDFMIGEVTNVLIWAIAGLGLMALTGQAGLVSLGHTAFLAIGCYVNAILVKAGVPFLIAFPVAGLAAGLFGVIVAVPALRLHGIYLAIATLALAVLVEDLIVILAPWTGGISGLAAHDLVIFGLRIDRYGTPQLFYGLVLAVTLIVTLFYRNMTRSPLGRSLAAIRDSEISAQAMGIDLLKAKAAAFFISCTIVGLAGALMGHFAGAFNHETFNIILSIQLLLMIVVGGLGSIHGAFLGAMVVGLIPLGISMGRDLIGTLRGTSIVVPPGLEIAIFAAILIAFVLFEPQGLYGRWLKIRTYFSLFPFARRDMFRRQRTYLKTERMR